MRNVTNFNQGWSFVKNPGQIPTQIEENFEFVNLPHSWNAVDGQDGGNDYFRGTCYYIKNFKLSDLPQNQHHFLEINGANSSSDVYLNGKHLTHHDGGYSTYRVELTELQEENLLVVGVDNSANEHVYPQMADFTFYGGIYRNVNIISVPENHFELMYHGGPGIKVTPIVEGKNAKVEIEVYGNLNEELTYAVTDAKGKVVQEIKSNETKVVIEIESVHLWHGRKDPYLYTATVTLGNDTDKVSARFGCRTFEIHPENGFILNGEEYPLRGVSRHQDRWGIGNALLPEHHIEDMDLICEVGATTIRLAHYQHDQFFYDLCDERGMVIWAEIPYISQHMATGRENTISQMKELIIQNYNHPSIITWGLSNEITISTKDNKDMLDNHRVLNVLCHEMDATRPTSIACYAVCGPFNKVANLSDLVSWNLYLGWYVPGLFLNDLWIDFFHAKYPNRCLGYS